MGGLGGGSGAQPGESEASHLKHERQHDPCIQCSPHLPHRACCEHGYGEPGGCSSLQLSAGILGLL